METRGRPRLIEEVSHTAEFSKFPVLNVSVTAGFPVVKSILCVIVLKIRCFPTIELLLIKLFIFSVLNVSR